MFLQKVIANLRPKVTQSVRYKSFVNTLVDDKSGIATVVMQKEPVNSLNLEMIQELKSTFSDLEKNKCNGMILTSASNSVFSAGLDIMEMYKPDVKHARDFWTNLQDMWMILYGSSFPTVAVINGHAPAGGCFLAISCEYRIMLRNFTIGLNETQLGILAPTWFAAVMENTIGFRQTELALITGRLFKTEEALSVGLIDEIADSEEEALNAAQTFFKRFTKIPPHARSLSKKVFRGRTIEALANNREKDTQAFLDVVTAPKTQKALEIYLQSLKQKRKN